MRIGLISDTHIPVAVKHLWPQVYEAFRGVDLIMHGGDLMVTDVLDWLMGRPSTTPTTRTGPSAT